MPLDRAEVENNSLTAALFAVCAVLVYPLPQNDAVSAQEDGTGICDRTRQVQDAILDKLNNIHCSAGDLLASATAKGIDPGRWVSYERLYLERTLETLPAGIRTPPEVVPGATILDSLNG